MTSLLDDAIAVLKNNDRGRHTVPSPNLYPHQWAWDSAFAAIGWAHFDPARARAELECLFSAQWPDGRVPHIRFDPGSTGYWPDASFWGTTDSTSITQPPVWATAALRCHELGVEGLAALVEPMERSHRFFAAARDPLGWGLVAVVHPWESGLDNAPAWDEPLEAIDPAQSPQFVRRDTEHVADPSERPTDDHYKRYAVIVKAIEAEGFGPGPFAVYDPLMSACLARGERDLAKLGRALGVETQADERAARIERSLVEHLWDEERGRFVYYDAVARRPITNDVIGGYLPAMLEGIASRDRLVANLASRFDAPFPLPSTSPNDPAFDARRYWRGPTWMNINWLLAPTVGPELVDRSLALVEKSGFREYYDPRTGDGLGADSFAWTAALVIDWLNSK